MQTHAWGLLPLLVHKPSFCPCHPLLVAISSSLLMIFFSSAILLIPSYPESLPHHLYSLPQKQALFPIQSFPHPSLSPWQCLPYPLSSPQCPSPSHHQGNNKSSFTFCLHAFMIPRCSCHPLSTALHFCLMLWFPTHLHGRGFAVTSGSQPLLMPETDTQALNKEQTYL